MYVDVQVTAPRQRIEKPANHKSLIRSPRQRLRGSSNAPPTTSSSSSRHHSPLSTPSLSPSEAEAEEASRMKKAMMMMWAAPCGKCVEVAYVISTCYLSSDDHRTQFNIFRVPTFYFTLLLLFPMCACLSRAASHVACAYIK